jgi:hypothetical protein
MKNFLRTIATSCMTLGGVVNQNAYAQDINKTAKAKMFAVSAGYEHFMGRWSRPQRTRPSIKVVVPYRVGAKSKAKASAGISRRPDFDMFRQVA